jgi:hypothetical protein
MGAVSTRPGIVTSPILRGSDTGGEILPPPLLVEIAGFNHTRHIAGKATSRTLSLPSQGSVRLVVAASVTPPHLGLSPGIRCQPPAIR